jgi:hypothetical protein
MILSSMHVKKIAVILPKLLFRVGGQESQTGRGLLWAETDREVPVEGRR